VIYVGERATLILPLAGLPPGGGADIVLASGDDGLPYHSYIDFHRVALEFRASGSVLIVEFAAFNTGLLFLPAIELGGHVFHGLSVEVASVLAGDALGLVLSNPALPLLMPGTALLVFGSLGLLALACTVAFLLVVHGPGLAGRWSADWKRRRKIAVMRSVAKRLQKVLAKNGRARDALDALAFEFRSFLSVFYGENCRAMTAGEIEKALSSGFLGGFFRRADELRFRGGGVGKDDVLALFADLRIFLEGLEKPPAEKSAGASSPQAGVA
ncbi:MAG: hypothetical protein FWG66_02120, partial [Spirochaetes bacterium]|nr:hypothetical protein [Spirochaetota bacterium]